MDEEIKAALDEEIKAQIDGLSSLSQGSKEKSDAVEDLTKLYKLRIEEVKASDAAILNEREQQLEEDKLVEQRKDRRLKGGIAIGELVATAGAFCMGLNFEKTGSICSTFVKKLINSWKPNTKL